MEFPHASRHPTRQSHVEHPCERRRLAVVACGHIGVARQQRSPKLCSTDAPPPPTEMLQHSPARVKQTSHQVSTSPTPPHFKLPIQNDSSQVTRDVNSGQSMTTLFETRGANVALHSCRTRQVPTPSRFCTSQLLPWRETQRGQHRSDFLQLIAPQPPSWGVGDIGQSWDSLKPTHTSQLRFEAPRL